MTLLRVSLLLLCIFSTRARWQAIYSYTFQMLLYKYSSLLTRSVTSIRGTLSTQKAYFVDDLNKCVFINKENNLATAIVDLSSNRVCGMFISSHFNHQLKPFVLLISSIYASYFELHVNKLETIWTGKSCPMHGVEIVVSGNRKKDMYCGVYLPWSLTSNKGGFLQITAYGYIGAFTSFKFEFFYHIISTGHAAERKKVKINYDITEFTSGVLDLAIWVNSFVELYFQARPFDQIVFEMITNGNILADDFNVHDGPGYLSRKLITYPLNSSSIQVYTSSFMAYFTFSERHSLDSVTFHVYSIFDRIFSRIPTSINIGVYQPCFQYISMHSVSADNVNLNVSQNRSNTACYYIYRGYSTDTIYYKKYPAVHINHLLYKGPTILQASTDYSCQYGGVFIFGMDPVKSQIDSLAMLCSDTDDIGGHSVPSPHTDLMIVVVGFGSYSQVSLKAMVSSSQCRSQYVHCKDGRPTMNLFTTNSDHCQFLVIERTHFKVTKERVCFFILQPISDLIIGPARITVTSEKRVTAKDDFKVNNCKVDPLLLVDQLIENNFTLESDIFKIKVKGTYYFDDTYRFLVKIGVRYHTCILNDKAIYVHIQKALCVSRSSYDTGFILFTKLFDANCQQKQSILVNMVNSNDTHTFIMALRQPQDMRITFVLNHENCLAECEEFEVKLTEANLVKNQTFVQASMSRIGLFVEMETKIISHVKMLQVKRKYLHKKQCDNFFKCYLVISTRVARNIATWESVRNTNKTWPVIFEEGG